MRRQVSFLVLEEEAESSTESGVLATAMLAFRVWIGYRREASWDYDLA